MLISIGRIVSVLFCLFWVVCFTGVLGIAGACQLEFAQRFVISFVYWRLEHRMDYIPVFCTDAQMMHGIWRLETGYLLFWVVYPGFLLLSFFTLLSCLCFSFCLFSFSILFSMCLAR
jgi:hypothetical protein